MTELNDFNAAARLREVIRKIATQIVMSKYPPPRYATVTAVDLATGVVTCVYSDDVTTFPIPGDVIAPQVGAVVRLSGPSGARYIDGIISGELITRNRLKVQLPQNSAVTWADQQIVVVGTDVGAVDRSGISFSVPHNGVAPLLVCIGADGEALQVRNAAGTGYVPIRASAFTVSSSERIKEDISDAPEDTLDKISELSAKTYRFTEGPSVLVESDDGTITSVDHVCSPELCGHTPNDPCSIIQNDTLRFGLIAEEVFNVFPEAVTLDNGGQPAGVDIDQIAALALDGVSRLSRLVADQTVQIAELQKMVQALVTVSPSMEVTVAPTQVDAALTDKPE